MPEEDMETDNQENTETLPSAPIVFNEADYGPVEVPEAVHSVATYASDGPRLMITQIVSTNFKSYAGVQTLGPFHRNFTAIVGPNGSGKSNVIDSMLFVFGYRANKIRSKKVSVLIHNSEKHQNIESCSVAVHFQKIIDTGPEDDDYTVVPDSQFVVSRAGYKDNSSSYFLDGKKAAYKDVARVLRGCGIDLDHNRFLILQGEVEQIAMMKPKAPTEHEDGMLEFLEDIIGSNRFKNPIDILTRRVENLNDLRAEKLNRVKAVEKEMLSLEGPKNEAEEYLNLENAICRIKHQLLQKEIHYVAELEKNAVQQLEKLKEEQKEYTDKSNAIKEQKNEKLKEFKKLSKEFDAALKAREDAKEKLSEAENQHAKCHEDLKLQKKNQKKTEKAIEGEELKIEELRKVPEQAETFCEELKKQLANLEKAKTTEQQKEKEIMDSLKDETKEVQAEKSAKEAELLEQQSELNDKTSKMKIAVSELDIYTSKEQSESSKLKKMKQKLDQAQAELDQQLKTAEKSEEYIPKMETELKETSKQLKEVTNLEKESEQKRQNIRSKLEEEKSSMAASKSQNRVLEALMNEKRKGNLPGIYGRLGDLGAIDAKYDVAISTACGSLDHIVVDTLDTGKQCLAFLKKHNVGQARLILLEKMEVWREATKKKIVTPENVPRLFDLVKVKEEKLKTCFYFALRDTLVSKDIDQATRIAYGRTRYRVVTIKGELIETSGAMSGGGNSVCRGKMGASIVKDSVDPQLLAKMETELETLNNECETLRHKKYVLEDKISQLEKDLNHMKHEAVKRNTVIQGLKDQTKQLTGQIKTQEEVLKAATPDETKLKQLQETVASCKEAYEGISKHTNVLEEEIKKLHNQIMEIGGAKLSMVQSRLKCIGNDIDKVTGQITKNGVGVKTAERNLKRAEDKLKTLKDDLSEATNQIASLEQKLKDGETEAETLLKLEKQLQAAENEQSSKLEGIRSEVREFEDAENEMAKSGVDLTNRLEKCQNSVREKRIRVKQGEKQLSSLSLKPVTGDENEDLNLPTLTEEELSAVDVQALEIKITTQEEQLKELKPNMAAIAEYRKKESTYLERVGELDKITNCRDEQRRQHDGLRKQRLEEFMEGFTVITTKLKEMYQMITLGGDAELELVDSLDPFSEGIVFSVRPPKKSWKNISNLSGGEKTLSSLALVFSLHHYKPSPLYVMDEIDAALDFKNVSIVAHYIKERTKNAQFIIISLRNNMFELSDRLVGIYKTHDTTKSVTLNPHKLQADFVEKINQVHNTVEQVAA